MKKILFLLVLVFISIILYFNYDNKDKTEIKIPKYNTFPPKEYLDKLEEMEVQ